MSWMGNGTESAFLWLVRDRGKQPGTGNPPSEELGEKEEINWDLRGNRAEPSADTVVNWSAKSVLSNTGSTSPHRPSTETPNRNNPVLCPPC